MLEIKQSVIIVCAAPHLNKIPARPLNAWLHRPCRSCKGGRSAPAPVPPAGQLPQHKPNLPRSLQEGRAGGKSLLTRRSPEAGAGCKTAPWLDKRSRKIRATQLRKKKTSPAFCRSARCRAWSWGGSLAVPHACSFPQAARGWGHGGGERRRQQSRKPQVLSPEPCPWPGAGAVTQRGGGNIHLPAHTGLLQMG